MSPPAIQCTDVVVNYGDVHALTGVNLTVEQGRICGLIGVNGSGKSTLFSALIGFTRLAEGSTSILGKSSDFVRRHGLVAFMPQSEANDINFPLGVRDVVGMGRYGHLHPPRRLTKADNQAIDEALERVELTDLQNRRIGGLSGGQRKRAFLARAIAQEAEVFLLDEPMSGVDAPTQERLSKVLRGLAHDNKTVLVSTHSLTSLNELCDEAALIFRKILLHDSVEVVTKPENLALAFGGED